VPNPGSTEMVLKLPSLITGGKAVIIDEVGRRMADVSFTAKKTVPIGQYLHIPGVYYYILQDATTGQRYTGRFIYR